MLIKIMPKPNKNAESIAASLELPLTARIHNPDSEGSAQIKTWYVLSNGSHHGYGLDALFAHELEKHCNGTANSLDTIRLFRESNLAILAKDPGNIASILDCLPGTKDPTRFIRHIFKEQCEGNPEDSAFAYFAKSNGKIPLETITPSHILVAEIFKYLQFYNHIEPSEKLQKKLEYVLGTE